MTVNNDATAGRPRPHRFLHCDWLQPRVQPRRKMNMFISGCSHIAVASQSHCEQRLTVHDTSLYSSSSSRIAGEGRRVVAPPCPRSTARRKRSPSSRNCGREGVGRDGAERAERIGKGEIRLDLDVCPGIP